MRVKLKKKEGLERVAVIFFERIMPHLKAEKSEALMKAQEKSSERRSLKKRKRQVEQSNIVPVGHRYLKIKLSKKR